MHEFKKFIDDIGGIWALILAGGSLLPVLGLFSGLAPQGRFFTDEVLAALTGFLALLVLLNVWVFGRGLRKRTGKMVFGLLSVSSLAILIVYFYLITRFQLDASGEKFIAGCEWTPFALGEARLEGMADPQTCPGDAQFLLDDAARPAEIWTASSMGSVERGLYLAWAGLTVSWSSLVSFFALAFLKGSGREGEGAVTPAGT